MGQELHSLKPYGFSFASVADSPATAWLRLRSETFGQPVPKPDLQRFSSYSYIALKSGQRRVCSPGYRRNFCSENSMIWRILIRQPARATADGFCYPRFAIARILGMLEGSL